MASIFSFSLYGAQKQPGGVAAAVEDQEEEIVSQRTDDGGDDQTPNGTLHESKTRRLEALALDHHAGLERLDGDLHDLGGADQKTDEKGGHAPQGVEKFRHSVHAAQVFSPKSPTARFLSAEMDGRLTPDNR